jgi:transposase
VEEHTKEPGRMVAARVGELHFTLSYQFRKRGLRDWDNQHLLKVLRGYHRQGALLRFLEEPLVEPTNRVERALRPAVIARKVSQCSKNDVGPMPSLPSRA